MTTLAVRLAGLRVRTIKVVPARRQKNLTWTRHCLFADCHFLQPLRWMARAIVGVSLLMCCRQDSFFWTSPNGILIQTQAISPTPSVVELPQEEPFSSLIQSTMVVHDVVDIEVHFDKLCLNLEDGGLECSGGSGI